MTPDVEKVAAGVPVIQGIRVSRCPAIRDTVAAPKVKTALARRTSEWNLKTSATRLLDTTAKEINGSE